MAEVIDWSPVDESNNSPPPVGAPEHHAPSATNNIMRAMMGSIRRWHDTVNAKLGTFLPLSGGTVTGNTAFKGPLGIEIQGTWLDGDGAGNLIVRNVAGGDVTGAIHSIGRGAAFAFSDRDMVSPAWIWYANVGNAIFGRYGEAPIINVSWAGVVTVTGNLAVTSDLTATGNITATGYMDASTLRGNYIFSDGNIHATGAMTCVTLTTSGNITATGSLNGAHVESSSLHIVGNTVLGGTLAVGSSITGNTVAANSVNATNITGGSVVGTGSLATRDVGGDITCGLYTSGSVSYLQFLNQPSNANRWEFNGSNGDLQWRSLNTVHWVMRRSPIGSSDNMCFNALGPVGGLGAYYNSSDRRFKEDIEPARCGLDTVLDLNPVSFRRIGQNYREVGFIAQELREVVPEAVRVVGIPLPDDTGGHEDENPTLGVDTTPIIAALVNAVQELSGRIKTLERNAS